MSWQTFRTVAFLKNFDFEETSLEATEDHHFVSQGKTSGDQNKRIHSFKHFQNKYFQCLPISMLSTEPSAITSLALNSYSSQASIAKTATHDCQ